LAGIGEPSYGLRLGASQDIGDGSILGFVMLNSADAPSTDWPVALLDVAPPPD
jgi:hypothetical protein